MKNLKELREVIYQKSFTFPGSDLKLELYRFDISEVIGKQNSLATLTVEPDCIQVSVRLANGLLPSFEDCVNVKKMLFDDDEAVFLILKNLRIVDKQNLDVRMFFSKEINVQAEKMNFVNAMENISFVYSKKRPLLKTKKTIKGINVNIVSMEDRFPSLEVLEETYRFSLKIPLICIKDEKISLNQKHMVFICDGEKMKLPKFVRQICQIKK